MAEGAASERDYLRQERLPTMWCPGCGNGLVMKAIIKAVMRLGLDRDEVALLSGIGCSGRISGYVDFNTMHTTHGRALAFATGLKLSRPELKVIVVMGDGDALAIGGNHLIHAARRNMDLTAVVVNNSVYGMTGGQVSPLTPHGVHALTAPHGNVEQPFDVVALAEAAGASFVARSTVFHMSELEQLLARGVEKEGFSLVEAISNCPVHYGRHSQMGGAIDMLTWYRDNTMSVRVPAERRGGKIVRGVLVDRERPSYSEQYGKLVHRLQREEGPR